MNDGFAIFIMSPQARVGQQLFRGAIIGRCPGFQFVETGPWRLYDAGTERQHTVEYMMPSHIELGGSCESPVETVRRCFQSIAVFPFVVTPAPDQSVLPTIMGFASQNDVISTTNRFRCICWLASLTAVFSPDINALLHDTAELERDSVRMLDGIPGSRNRQIASVVEEFQAAANATVLQEGMVLPCETQSETATCYGVCSLVEQIEGSRFLCDLYFERPIAIRPGMKLTRKVACEKHRSRGDVTFAGDVAQVVEMISRI